MASARPGRPRASGDSVTGRGTRADILEASAELFCTRGYGVTSTHAIAEAAGIRQASLYHHFAGKAPILLELLLSTVQPSLDAAAQLLAAADDPAARLWALCACDARLLASGRHNIGALYLAPEISAEAFAPFRERRSELETAYRTLVAACGVPAERTALTAQLVLALVESVILQRRRGLPPSASDLVGTATATLRLVGVPSAAIAITVTQGQALASVIRPR